MVESPAKTRFGAFGRLLGPPGLNRDTVWHGLTPEVLFAVLVCQVQALREVNGDYATGNWI